MSSDEDEDEIIHRPIELNKKRPRGYSDEDVDSDDLDLIQSNTGLNLKKRRKKPRRARLAGSDEDEDSEADDGLLSGGEQKDDRETIAKELFDDDEDDDEVTATDVTKGADAIADLEGSSSSDEDDLKDFIVDEHGRPVKQRKMVDSYGRPKDRNLLEAEAIFGGAFDPNEFLQYGSEEELEEESEEEKEDSDSDLSFIEGSSGKTSKKPRAMKKRKHKKGKSIYETYEPAELERSHLTDFDQTIRMTDVPERFQLRPGGAVIPLEDHDEVELADEAAWVYQKALTLGTISNQESTMNRASEFSSSKRDRKPEQAIPKVREVLHLIRKDLYEVPFIANYRKECYETELSIDDLWKIYFWDQKWCQLQKRKRNLRQLFEDTQRHQVDMARTDERLLEGTRPIDDDYFSRLEAVQSVEELKDVYQHFMLYHHREVVDMHNLKSHASGDPEESRDRFLKRAQRRTHYTVCRDAGLGSVAEKFGLTPSQLGANLENGYQRYEVEQCTLDPEEAASEFTGGVFSTADDVLRGACHMVATEVAHEPTIRRVVRSAYYQRAKLSARPTKKGLKNIDEWSPLSPLMYLRDKPVRELKDEQFLILTKAERDGLLTMSLSIDFRQSSSHMVTYAEEIKTYFTKDEFSSRVEKWNALRADALRLALEKSLYPMFAEELKIKLVKEAQDCIIQNCGFRLRELVEIAPFQPESAVDEDSSVAPGLRVLAVGFVPDRSMASFLALLNGNGQVVDFLRLGYLLERNEAKRAKDMDLLQRFILRTRPVVIAVTANGKEAQTVCETMKTCVSQLEQEHQMAPIVTELVNGEVARIFERSPRGETEFRDYNELLRHAVSLGRRLQDPLAEFCYLAEDDDELLCLKLHDLQDEVPKEELLQVLHVELINRINEVGVDINKAVEYTHWSSQLSFVGGLGVRKAVDILKKLKVMPNKNLENRSQLITSLHMGPKVFLNCAGFIKINTQDLESTASEYLDVLDNSRIHPETYDWARKMAVDALEYDDMGDEGHPSAAVDEIVDGPERLKDLDLDAFAEELERQGFGNRTTTLYDIRDELFGMYRERRSPFRGLSGEERFRLLTGETRHTLSEGRLVMGTVAGITRRKPTRDMLDQANPEHSEETGLWRCPFCLLDTFTDLSEVWSHFDDNSCAGQATGIRLRLENGITGFIPTKFISDSHVRSPEERVKMGMVIHCRVMRLNMDRFTVDLTCRSSDLADKDGRFSAPKDAYYDHERADEDKAMEKKEVRPKSNYLKRVIVHPNFHNVGFKQAEKMLAEKDIGDAIIRPSSKGSDHLTLTWKIDNNLYQHIDILERDKANHFTLGKSLWIENEEFEDLDEILARHISPMVSLVQTVLDYKYYRHADGGNKPLLESMLSAEKRQQPSRIPYLLSASRELPGKFLLSYMPRSKGRHEYVTVTPNGYRYRGRIYSELDQLLAWFKKHFRDPVPGSAVPALY